MYLHGEYSHCQTLEWFSLTTFILLRFIYIRASNRETRLFVFIPVISHFISMYNIRLIDITAHQLSGNAH